MSRLRHALLCALALLGAARVEAREVHIRVGHLSARATTNAPLEMLANAMHHDKSSRRFRVSWRFFTSLRSIEMTALYDRRRRRVKNFSTQVSDAAISTRRVSRKCHFYLGVTDAMIFQLAAKNRSSKEGIDGFFSQLPSVGARRRDIR